MSICCPHRALPYQGVQRECSESRNIKAQGLLYNHPNSLPMKEVSIPFTGIQKDFHFQFDFDVFSCIKTKTFTQM